MQKKNNKETMKRVLKYIRKYTPALVLSLLLAGLTSMGRHQRNLPGNGKACISLFKENVRRSDAGISRTADSCI